LYHGKSPYSRALPISGILGIMNQNVRRAPYYASIFFLVYMPFHIFLAQWLSTLTGGLSAWKLGNDVLLAAVVLFAICLVWWRRCSTRLFNVLVGLTVMYGVLHLLLWATHADIYRDSALLGLVYNVRVFCFAVLGYAAALLWPGGVDWRFVLRLVLGVSTLVAILGIVQYFLPKDFLTHFGYSLQRGVRPAFFIDDRPNLPRIISTLRDPNSLGAYLIVPITALSALLVQLKNRNQRLIVAGMLGLQLLALFLTFSRSAWLAAALSMVLVMLMQYRLWLVRMGTRYWPAIAVLVVLFAGGLFAGRHSYVIHGLLSHNTGKPQAQYDSNGFHREFAKRGLEGIVHQPLGHGPGTAGLASIQNPKGSFLTENYYLQIGYEVGVLGLLLFVAVQVLVYVQLWRRRHDRLAAILLASFWAYVLTSMLLHTWSNEAIAAQWWILAGLLLAVPARQRAQ
jgi:O-Antigen ligase